MEVSTLSVGAIQASSHPSASEIHSLRAEVRKLKELVQSLSFPQGLEVFGITHLHLLVIALLVLPATSALLNTPLCAGITSVLEMLLLSAASHAGWV